MNDRPTFEESYPKYEFAELVRLGIAIGSSILWMLGLAKAPWPSASALNQLSPTQAMLPTSHQAVSSRQVGGAQGRSWRHGPISGSIGRRHLATKSLIALVAGARNHLYRTLVAWARPYRSASVRQGKPGALTAWVNSGEL